MSRDSNGNYTLPAGNPVTSGTVIESNWANPTMSDLANEITNSLSRTGKGGMLVPLKFVDGGVSDPAMAFTSEPTSGMYRAGTNDVRISVGAIDKMRFNADGVQVYDPVADQWNQVLGGGIAEVTTALVGMRVWLPPQTTNASVALVEEYGAELSREAYPLLWQHAQDTDNILTEANWQATVTTSPVGACSQYSYGDGSTTFRVPTVGVSGGFTRAVGVDGLAPVGSLDGGFEDQTENITGSVGTTSPSTTVEDGELGEGALYVENEVEVDATIATEGNVGTAVYGDIKFDASRDARTGDETTPKGVYKKPYIYTGNSIADAETPEADWLSQQAVNTNNITLNINAISTNSTNIAENTDAIAANTAAIEEINLPDGIPKGITSLFDVSPATGPWIGMNTPIPLDDEITNYDAAILYMRAEDGLGNVFTTSLMTEPSELLDPAVERIKFTVTGGASAGAEVQISTSASTATALFCSFVTGFGGWPAAQVGFYKVTGIKY